MTRDASRLPASQVSNPETKKALQGVERALRKQIEQLEARVKKLEEKIK